MVYSQVLKSESGLVRFKYPLGSGSRVNPQPAASAAGTVTVHSPVGLKNIYSPSHGIDVRWSGEKEARIGFETSGNQPMQDFLLYYSPSDKEFGISLMTYRETDEDGYFLLLLSPKLNLSATDVQAKDIVFVLDTSGSMREHQKIDQAKEALRFGLRRLHPNDTFNLITFATDVQTFKPQRQTASKSHIEEAIRFVDKISANGGTNIYEALTEALKQFAENARPHYLVFLTDGQPTVGPSDTFQILKAAKAANKASTRLFCFGVGYDVSTQLLDRLAGENGGAGDYITPKENLELKVSSFFDKINSPVLADIQFDTGKLTLRDHYPRKAPDLFKGTQISILGRYSADGSFPVAVTGKINGTPRRFTYSASFPRTNKENEFLPRLWAMRKVGYLLEQIRLNGESAELKSEVTALAKKYGFVTPYTSYLAVEDTPLARQAVLPAGAPPVYSGGGLSETVVTNEAYGERMSKRGVIGGPVSGGIGDAIRLGEGGGAGSAHGPGVGSGKGSGFGPGMGGGAGGGQGSGIYVSPDFARIATLPDAGQEAVDVSKALNFLKENAQNVQGLSPAHVRNVGNNTFVLVNNVWVDTNIGEGNRRPVVKIKFGSEGYYKLVMQEPDLAKFLSLGERVKVLYKDKVYEVGD